jgi:KDO2-lipid IV(A) lauroyltransferase
MAGIAKGLARRIGRALFYSLEKYRLLMGRRAGQNLGRRFGSLWYRLLRLDTKRLVDVRTNLRRMEPTLTDGEADALIRRVCRHWGLFLLEGMGQTLLPGKPALARDMAEIRGIQRLRAAHAQGKGVILATAHFGHFELANSLLALDGFPISSVIRTVDDPWVDATIDRIRTATGSVTIKKESAARDILKALRQQRIVAINVDQNAAFNHVFTPFFGELAATFATPAVLGLRTGAPVLPMFCAYDDATDRWIVTIHPPIDSPGTGDKDADIRYVTTRINAAMERAIRQTPEQWLWIHRRWKTRPDPVDIEAYERESAFLTARLGPGWEAPTAP